jgi:hypothetical protein
VFWYCGIVTISLIRRLIDFSTNYFVLKRNEFATKSNSPLYEKMKTDQFGKLDTVTADKSSKSAFCGARAAHSW